MKTLLLHLTLYLKFLLFPYILYYVQSYSKHYLWIG